MLSSDDQYFEARANSKLYTKRGRDALKKCRFGAQSAGLYSRAASPAPRGVSVILEIDPMGKAKVVLQGKPGIDLGFLIQSPDPRP